MMRHTSLFHVLFLAVLFACVADVEAQTHSRPLSTFGQDVPPFLRDKPASRTYQVGAKTVVIPSLRLPGSAFYPSFLDRGPLFLASLPNRLPDLDAMRGRQFNFGRSLPHLAFFCRLEINEDAGFVIPARFRLGGHRHWQDDL